MTSPIPTVAQWHGFRDKVLQTKPKFGGRSITDPLKKFHEAIRKFSDTSREQVRPLNELTRAVADYKKALASDLVKRVYVPNFSRFLEEPIKQVLKNLELVAHPVAKLKFGMDALDKDTKTFMANPTKDNMMRMVGAKQTINQATTRFKQLELVKQDQARHQFLVDLQSRVGQEIEEIARLKLYEPGKAAQAKAAGLKVQKALLQLYSECKKRNVFG